MTRHNEYSDRLGRLFEEMPKAVLAAVAVSALTAEGDYLEEAAENVAHEWRMLYENGIVPQRPSALARELSGEHEAREERK